MRLLPFSDVHSSHPDLPACTGLTPFAWHKVYGIRSALGHGSCSGLQHGSHHQGVCRLVKYMFLEAGTMQSDSYCQDEAPWAPLLLGPHCPLFARKFPEDTASQVPTQQLLAPRAAFHA